jgi:hypothetical protein
LVVNKQLSTDVVSSYLCKQPINMMEISERKLKGRTPEILFY